MGFNGAGGVGGSSLRRHGRLRQGGGEVKMAFDTRRGRAASASMSGVGVGGGSGGSGGGGHCR
jgi:hypothetical protein